MNPGLVVKLRPAGPWRIGPDSGARNRVDSIYHSDSLYSAVASAMAQLGSLDEWLAATARAAAPAVSFGSCFPFLDEIVFVVPPRTVWPPASPALLAARVRWKSARFVPLGIVQALLEGRKLEEHRWSVDGLSQCLVPAGRPGPFRIDIRWNAAVDRLTGSSERHSTACLEFRPGAGLWTVVSFVDEASRDRWLDPVKAAFRLLADTGFGGRRSRGWGRSEAPEFIDGQLPGMILPPPPAVEARPQAAVEPASVLPPVEEPPAADSVVIAAVQAAVETSEIAGEPPIEEPPAGEETGIAAGAAVVDATDIVVPLVVEQPAAVVEEPVVVPPAEAPPAAAPSPQPVTEAPAPEAVQLHWLLSLFSPAAADAVDWTGGNYSVITRGGRVESPAGSGDPKKLVQMIAEGSVLCGVTAPVGAAPNVAPDGFAHPVFRAGFAVAIPLPRVRS